jgi:hypothetical protein
MYLHIPRAPHTYVFVIPASLTHPRKIFLLCCKYENRTKEKPESYQHPLSDAALLQTLGKRKVIFPKTPADSWSQNYPSHLNRSSVQWFFLVEV